MPDSVEVTGIEEIRRALKAYDKGIEKASVKVLQKYGPKIEIEAKGNHRFNVSSQAAQDRHRYPNRKHYKPTGNTERSIQAQINVRRMQLKFWINPDIVTTADGWNIGWVQNDGSKNHYKKGKISPLASSSGGRGGVPHDDFMGRAWDKYLPRMQAEINAIPQRVAREVGLQ
jgi:hypothetical protein